MPVFLRFFKGLGYHVRQLSWPVLGLLFLLHMAVAWALMAWAGEQKLVFSLADWLYFYMTTATTIGYGDLSPQGAAGRLVAALFLQPTAVALFTAFVSKVIASLIFVWRKKMAGKGSVENKAGHTIVVGWLGAESHRMIDMLLKDVRTDDEGIVIVDQALEQNPRPDVASFIRVESLAQPSAYLRAGLKGAQQVIVNTPNDEATLSACFALAAARPDIRIVARFEKRETAALVRAHHAHVEPIMPMVTELLVRTAQDAGSADVAQDLLSLDSGASQFSDMLPVGMPGIDFASIQKAFKQGADVTVIGIRRGLDPVLNPPASLRVDGGTVMYYIGAQRLSSEDILRTVKALG
jgi:voltage-gated potassium channel